MALIDIFLRDPLPLVYLAIRTDGQLGNGTIDDPYDASSSRGFDAIMTGMPANAQIHVGPGLFQTTGYTDGPPMTAGWQPKPGQKIIGSGVDVSTLRLVVPSEIADAHYWAVGAAPGTLLDFFEISDMTIDCANAGFPNAASGAIRFMGSHTRVRRIKAINWGTKSAQTGCFVFSSIVADWTSNVRAETIDSGIEDCIAVQPSYENRREVTVFHLGGIEDATTHAQGYGRSPYLRNSFVDAASYLFVSSPFDTAKPAMLPIISAQSVSITGSTGKLTFSRAHHWKNGIVGSRYVLITNPNDPASLWNGYFLVTKAEFDSTHLTYSLEVDLLSVPAPPFTTTEPLIVGSAIRGIAISSCRGAIIDGNEFQNCWIGGPYQDSLNTREAIIRGNTYKNVVAAPYFNLGGLSGSMSNVAFTYDSVNGGVTGITPTPHGLFTNVWIYVQGTGAFDGFRQVTSATRTTFIMAYSGPAGGKSGTYQTLWGVDKLLIENNVIELADLDATDYAVPNLYPATGRRPTAVLVNDTPASGPLPVQPAFAHGDVIIRDNQIRYLDGAFSQAPSGSPLAGTAMQIAGAKNLVIQANVVESVPLNPVQNLRCGSITYFENKDPKAALVRGTNAADGTHYSELETLAEDALLLNLIS